VGNVSPLLLVLPNCENTVFAILPQPSLLCSPESQARIDLSVDNDGVLALANPPVPMDHPAEMMRAPYVFEFWGLKKEQLYPEAQIKPACATGERKIRERPCAPLNHRLTAASLLF
jgi:hypothetical protein